MTFWRSEAFSLTCDVRLSNVDAEEERVQTSSPVYCTDDSIPDFRMNADGSKTELRWFSENRSKEFPFRF